MIRSTTFSLLACTLIATPALAQGFPGGGFPGGGFPLPGGTFSHTVATSGNFAALAHLGTASGFQSLAGGSAITLFSNTTASAGGGWSFPFPGGFPSGGGLPGGSFPGFPGFGDSATAASLVMLTPSSSRGAGVLITESGSVRNSDASRGASAGTSADAPGTASPGFAGHGVQVSYAAIAAGTNAIVSINWLGTATTGASAGATVDVNGDGTPDFTGTADGNRASAALQVTAGGSGVVLHIVTTGNAAVPANGRESYNATLQVSVIAGSLPTSCTFTNFGAPCGADLNGSVGTNLSLSLDVTNAAASTFGFLLVGGRATTPGTSPFSSCPLLVDSSRFFGGVLFRTDAAGAATIGVRTPITAITTSFQALVLDLASTPRSLDASNGTELVCQ